MKCILGLLALTLPLISAAQQSSSKAITLPDDYCKNAMFKTLCDQGLKELKEAEQAGDQVEELRKAVEELRSADTAQQTKGVTDAGKIINSHANNNPVSKEVTDKALSVTERFAQMENGSLDNTEKSIQSGFAPTSSNTPFNASEQHQLHESTRTDIGSQPLTIEQRYQQQEQVLISAPPTRSAVAEPEPMKTSVGSQLSVKERYNNQENVILLSPSNVKAVADAERARQKAEQERLALVAKREAERRAEVEKQAREQAEAQRIAKIERDRAEAADDAAEEREERREAAREAREQRAAWNALFGPPAQAASPYYPAQSGLENNYPDQYFPSPASIPSADGGYQFVPQYSPGGGSADPYIVGLPVSNSRPAWKTIDNAFDCMANLSTEATCLANKSAAAGIDTTPVPLTSVFDMFDAHQSASQNGSGNANNSSGQPPPAQTPPAQGTPTTAH